MSTNASVTNNNSSDRELSALAVLIGVALTVVFTAANVFLGLRIGINFATSIPAAVLSMVMLRALGQSGILQNNIVQTIASAAGTLASVIYVLPGLVIVGWWAGFPFWTSFLVCASGGLLGVMLSIPLRRALVVRSNLAYPEGRAAAEVLKVGCAENSSAGGEAKAGFIAIMAGGALSAGYSLLGAMRVVASDVSYWFRLGSSATGVSFSFSLALLGVGHLIGTSAGLAALLGLLVAYGVLTPLLSALHAAPGTAMEAAIWTWSHEVRFIGAGAIGAAALWTFFGLLRPVIAGLRESLARGENSAPLPQERDLSPRVIAAVTAALVVPITFGIHSFLNDGALAGASWQLVLSCTFYVLVASAFVASVCGYMAGLVGSSSSPISGVGILVIVGIAAILALAFSSRGTTNEQLIALALFTTTFVIAAATIANDNLQDLKTGHLVGATPWKQQLALMIGVVAGALTIPVVLDLLARTYGFGDVSPAHPHALPAPQATLITALAKGTLAGDLDWSLIAVGVAIGAAAIALDAAVRKTGRAGLPPLAVGIGIYLPMTLTLPIIVGALLSHVWRQRTPDQAKHRVGVLMASGLIVGESLFGVLLTIPIAITGNATPLALVSDSFAEPGLVIGAVVFVAMAVYSYQLVERQRQPAT
ncbi:MAG TPA: oligopeptide transporter, OPT family [Steroidobacter sp.]|uniref:OPT family oligopeptide transporter n=1 Tax=Steroidobacter sp. TaxID=1978227 RepID=UPI002EDA6809